MSTSAIVCLVAYCAVLGVLGPYAFHRLYLTALYRKHSGERPEDGPAWEGALPPITVQLPVYNERYVVERLVRAAAALDYPRELLEIQVLDDSTDETRGIVASVVRELVAEGVDVKHVRRADRRGFKAGALAHGLERARGRMIAVFDADFVPAGDLLHRLLAPMRDPGVGMVQARWAHVNRDYSLLTRLQAILLDAHFVIEHTARNRAGCFFNFNGTAGMWRREAIADAGGWRADTVTEDLDLSYRAQLAGWRFVYLKDVTVESELPVEWAGFLSQQRRWVQGSVQTLRKDMPAILAAPIPTRVKREAWFHLGGNLCYLAMPLLLPLLAFWMAVRPAGSLVPTAAFDVPLLLVATVGLAIFYGVAAHDAEPRGWRRWPWVPLAMALGIGLSFSNARAVMRGLTRMGGTFERTPKYGIAGRIGSWRDKSYRAPRTWPVLEALYTALGLAAMGIAVARGFAAAIPFLALFAIGYGLTTWGLLVERRGGPARGPVMTPALRLGSGDAGPEVRSSPQAA